MICLDYEKFASLIKEARCKKNLTQKDLSDMLYVTDRAVSKWERGKSLPDISMLKKISEVLDIDINELLEIEKDKKDHKMFKRNAINYYLVIFIVLFLILCLVLLFILSFNKENEKKSVGTKKDLKYVESINGRDIFYNNIDDFFIEGIPFKEKLNDLSFDFIDFMEHLDNKGVFYDGGSVMYSYNDYNILSCHTVSENNDIIIGNKYMEYQDNFCKNEKNDYLKCIYKDIFKIIDINDGYNSKGEYAFITIDKFQDFNPFIVKVNNNFLNGVEKNNYYEFKFLYYYPSDIKISNDADVFNNYELLSITKVLENGLLDTSSNSCEKLVH